MMKNCLPKNFKFSIVPSSKDELWLLVDIETDGLYDKVTKLHCTVIQDYITGQVFSYGPGEDDAVLEHLSKADVLIGHNICFYDLPVLKKLHLDFQHNARIIDTLLCTRLIWPKEILYDLDTEQYTEVPTKLKGSASLKAWGYRLSDNKIDFKDFSEYSEEMLAYCKQDVAVTKKLFEFIQKQNCSEETLLLEHVFANAIEKQIRTGFPFDVDACLDLVDDLRTKQTELETKLKEIFPAKKLESIFVPKVNNVSRGYVKGVPFTKVTYQDFNPGSRTQTVERLKEKYDWVPTKTTEKGNPILDDDLLETLPYPEAKLLAEYQLVKKRLSQIKDGNNAWLKLVNNVDGCIHGDLVTNGCITGRCAHRNPNMGQVPASYSPYGKECRSLFLPVDGWNLIGVDAKALELRCLAGYLASWDQGEYAALVTDESVDIHVYNQQQFGVETRDISKRLLYGMLYGCGAIKAGTIIDSNEKDTDVLRQLGSNAINSFMDNVPALKKLKESLSLVLSNKGYLRGLDKRTLYCRSEFKALNVLLQAAGAVLMKQVVVNIHNNMNDFGLVYGTDWVQHAMVHDEVQLSCQPQHTALVQEQALKAFPQAQQFFNFQCSIDGDSRVGSNWSETH